MMSAACSREAQKSDNLSTKCLGLLRSSLSIWTARVRHLFNAVSTAAFSNASRLSNSSDILLPDIFRAAPLPSVACCPHQVQSFDLSQTFWCVGFNEQIFRG